MFNFHDYMHKKFQKVPKNYPPNICKANMFGFLLDDKNEILYII